MCKVSFFQQIWRKMLGTILKRSFYTNFSIQDYICDIKKESVT